MDTPLHEPMITLKVEGKPIDLLVDMGSHYSVPKKTKPPNTPWCPGAAGSEQYCWKMECHVDLRKGSVTHPFLVIPECPYPLLGRDLIHKLKVQITFEEGDIIVKFRDKGGKLRYW